MMPRATQRVAVSLALAVVAANGASPAAAAEPVTAAVNIGRFDASFEVEGTTPVKVEIGRAGLEYWETLAGGVDIGLEFGLSESERLDTASNVIRGNYAGLAVRYQPRFGGVFGLDAQAAWRVQDDERQSGTIERDIRLYETHARLAPELHFGPLAVSAGGEWRRIDYRERHEDGSLAIRVSEESGILPFAAVAVRTDDNGRVRLEYTTEEQPGWRIRFERNF